ncbi:unnamed protein product, partial [Heterotrigona itama]
LTTVLECAVCLQPCIYPARLPCNHIYCYLCVKGVANQSKRCPMCRQEIPPDFLNRPQLVEVDEAQKESEHFEEEYQWFYEGWWKYDSRTSQDLEAIYNLGSAQCEILICGMLYVIDFKNNCQYRKHQPYYKRNIKRDRKDAPCKGWWQYDQRTSHELETAYKQGKRNCELLIAGFLYIADFGSMLQLRRNDPSRRRKIKRDLYNVPKKGVAGLRLNNQDEEITREVRGAERPASPASDDMGTGDGTNTPVPPSNTPQTPAGGTASGDATPLNDRMEQRDSLHQVLEQMRSLVLREHLSSDTDDELEEDEESESPSTHPTL